MLLNVQDLDIKIGQNHPVRKLSFQLNKGHILGITGESGSGKSMTAFAVMGLLPDETVISGEMTFDGTEHNPLNEADMIRRRSTEIGIVFQEPMTALNPLMTIGDQVAELFRHHRRQSRAKARSNARELLNRVGLSSIPHKRYPHQLSGGQRQRVSIAMAIALKPKLLLADEPTTALDTNTQMDILNLLERLVREDGMTMILITHDLALMATYADDILVMSEGQKAISGPVETMLSPDNDVLAGLIEASRMPPTQKDNSGQGDVLKVERVRKSYHRKRLFKETHEKPQVDDVSFTLAKGQMLGLVGRSGCGKSTLSKIALALMKADDGSIIFHDQQITPNTISWQMRPRLSAVFQDPYGSFNPKKRIGDLVAEPLWLEKPSPDLPPIDMRINNALTAVGIPPTYRTRLIKQCSGGERQRIAFARALITRPDVIILDEPVSALDACHRGQVMAEMARLSREQNIATLFISHDLSVVRAFCPHVMVMCKGQIVERGPTEEIFASPQHPETWRLIKAMPDLERALGVLSDKHRST
jgi:peptide/nickel transport system ATP-binding protein